MSGKQNPSPKKQLSKLHEKAIPPPSGLKANTLLNHCACRPLKPILCANPCDATEQTDTDFTVTVTAAMTGKLLCAVSTPTAGSLHVRYLKLAIQKRLGLPSPFAIRLLQGTETLDDFLPLQECTNTRELHLEFLVQKRTRPMTCQQLALKEAIGYQLPCEV